MRKPIVFIIAVGIACYAVIGQDTRFAARGENILPFFGSETDRFSSQDTSSVDSKPLPLVTESRGLATGFQPVIKPYAPRLAVPTAHASIVMDVDSGEILHSENADERRQIASLTKLFTATIVVERISDLNEPVTIDEEAVYAEGTRIGCPRSGFCNGERLKIGEQVRVSDLLKAALMNSSNDAAIALGKHIGGTQEGFARIMNARAAELWLVNSHFCTPSGLEPDGRESECYSSAFDVAKITAHALKYDILWDMMRFDKTFITSVDGKYTHEIFNTDELLGQLPNLVGTKTGFTPRAGYSLLAVAENQNLRNRIVAVVLDDPYRWQSVRSMFDWGFEAFDWQ